MRFFFLYYRYHTEFLLTVLESDQMDMRQPCLDLQQALFSLYKYLHSYAHTHMHIFTPIFMLFFFKCVCMYVNILVHVFKCAYAFIYSDLFRNVGYSKIFHISISIRVRLIVLVFVSVRVYNYTGIQSHAYAEVFVWQFISYTQVCVNMRIYIYLPKYL